MAEHHISLDALRSIRDGTGHSIFSASSSSMWLACSGSLIPNLFAPDESGVDAAYGTVAHGVTEEWLNTKKRPVHLVGKLVWVQGREEFNGFGITIDEQMLHYAEQCYDRCAWLPGRHLVEYRVNYSKLTPIPNQGGTLDHAAMEPGRATLTDHKFGSSPENIVMAEKNTQLVAYALGLNTDFGAEYRFKDYILRVSQPRLNHFDEWHVTKTELIEWAAYFRERAAAAWQLDAPRTPGVKQCRWCRVAPSCSAFIEFQSNMLNSVFGDTTKTAEQMSDFKQKLDAGQLDLKMPPVGELSTEQMAKLLPFRSLIEAFWPKLEEELKTRALAGKKVPGHKLVEARVHRRWRNPVNAVVEMRQLGLGSDDIYSEKMISPAQAEELIAKKKQISEKAASELLADQVFKPPGQPTLAPDTDKRPAFADQLSNVFTDTTQPATRETDEDF